MRREELQRGLLVNNVNLIGSVVNDPELSVERDGRDACAIQVAVQRRGPAGDPEPGVIYIDVTAYGQQARSCATELAVGDRIGVAGRLERDDSLDSRGPRRSRWEVHAYQVDFLDQAAPQSD
jgi:single stranded DNA-binding protein